MEHDLEEIYANTVRPAFGSSNRAESRQEQLAAMAISNQRNVGVWIKTGKTACHAVVCVQPRNRNCKFAD